MSNHANITAQHDAEGERPTVASAPQTWLQFLLLMMRPTTTPRTIAPLIVRDVGLFVRACVWALIVASPLIFCNAPIPPLSSVMRQNYQTSHYAVTVSCHTVTA